MLNSDAKYLYNTSGNQNKQMADSNPKASFTDMGALEGHSDWVTSILTGYPQHEADDSDVLVTSSRDKTILIWKLFNDNKDGLYGLPHKSLTGHNHFITDLALSNDNNHLISSSWDRTARLWDLKNSKTVTRFEGHTGELFSICFSTDNRQILTCGTDNLIKLWNTKGECKFTNEFKNHKDWVSVVRYAPKVLATSKTTFQPYFATAGWDGRLKIWNTNIQIRYSFKAHDSQINDLSISPNGMFIATGGRDQKVKIWDITNLEAPFREYTTPTPINKVAFNPKMQWISAATENGVYIWDITSEDDTNMAHLVLEQEKPTESKKDRFPKQLPCNAIAWNPTGKKIFAGFSNGKIKVWHASVEKV